MERRRFIQQAGLITYSALLNPTFNLCSPPFFLNLVPSLIGEDIPTYLNRVGGDRLNLYRSIAGNANEFKEGDEILGLAAKTDEQRNIARTLIENTKLSFVKENSIHEDDLSKFNNSILIENSSLNNISFKGLKEYLISTKDNLEIIKNTLTDDQIAFLVKICSNEELIFLSSKIFNPLPNSNIGSKGYFGARIQPNSPTDNTEDIFMQVLSAFSYGVGDVVIGTNPVDSNPDNIRNIENCLKDIVDTFQIQDILPYCVLSHIDIQAEIEEKYPDTTNLWFQSLAGTVNANKTFDLTIEKMRNYANLRKGPFGIYAETGQGADETNGHGEGVDLLIHESRKYGFLRALKSISQPGLWHFVNDVAGFIGPEVFRTKEQLVRCCLEDLVMGKLHGLCIGLDICTTLHMDVSLEDLEWCINEIMPANPAYMMALPTNNDPMLSYLTTSFSDHLKVRERFGYKVNQSMMKFFQQLGIFDEFGNPDLNFSKPEMVYLAYRRLKKDDRLEELILKEAKEIIQRVEERGVPIAFGYGKTSSDLNPRLEKTMKEAYQDAKYCLWQEFDINWFKNLNPVIFVNTQSIDRKDYVYHPMSGEELSKESKARIENIQPNFDVQLIISDGLNMKSISDQGHALELVDLLKAEFLKEKISFNPSIICIKNGRVRAGYRIGEQIFSKIKENEKPKTIIHLIGERPGTIHRNFSVYITKKQASLWRNLNKIDHDDTKVVSGISDTALVPKDALKEIMAIYFREDK